MNSRRQGCSASSDQVALVFGCLRAERGDKQGCGALKHTPVVVIKWLAAIGGENSERQPGASGYRHHERVPQRDGERLGNWSEIERGIRIDDDLSVRRGPTRNPIAHLDAQRFDRGCSYANRIDRSEFIGFLLENEQG